MRSMRSKTATALVVCAALAGCDRKPAPPTASGAPDKPPGAAPQPAAQTGSGSAAATAPAATAPAAAAPALPAGLRPLIATAPLPALTPDDMLLLAPAGGAVTIVGSDGKKLVVPDGLIARTTAPFELPGGLKFDHADLAGIVDPGDLPHTAQVVLRAEDSGGGVPHHEVWFVPTVGTRAQLARDASMIGVDWSDPQHRWAVVMLDEIASLVDVKTGAATRVAEHAGSPSFGGDGALYYRTLDGGAWKWAGDHAEKIGKGKRGKPQTGNLNDGLEPAQYPPAVTFDTSGKPRVQ